MIHSIKEGNFQRMGAAQAEQGVVFTFEGRKGQQCNIILYEKKTDCVERIAVPETYCIGSLRSVEIMDLQIEDYDYNFEIDGSILVDSYAKRIVGREKWFETERYGRDYQVRGGFYHDAFDWQEDCAPEISKEDMIMYRLHIRNFTMDGGAAGERKGTFEAVEKRIPYLKSLGITTVELMPVYEFEELVMPDDGKVPEYAEQKQQATDGLPTVEKVNCWGYTEGNYFAPKAAYAKNKNPEQSLKALVKALHKERLECIMEIYFPEYVNQNLILDALRFWVMEYHVDGFHLMGQNIPIRALVQDLILSRTKLFCDRIEEDLLGCNYNFPHLFLYRDEFLYPMRKLLNHQDGNLLEFVNQMRKQKEYAGFVNYAATSSGFTLADLFMYSEKHNEANGEHNIDGTDWNYSANYGVEGSSRKKYIQQLRDKQLMNAITIVMLAQGIPLIASGDEIANSQKGNNNAYCQDNRTGWINWKQREKYEWLLHYVQKMIAFRKEHPILHMAEPMKMREYHGGDYPDLSYHGENAWVMDIEVNRQAVGMLYCGDYAVKENGRTDDMVYVAYNFHTGKQFLALPKLSKSKKWYKVIDTGHESGFLEQAVCIDAAKIETAGISVQVLIGK